MDLATRPEARMDPATTAVVLIGYQRDYFASDGILHGFIEGEAGLDAALANTMDLLERLGPTSVTLVSTPIVFTPDYRELVDPVGILAAIKGIGAFRAGSPGAATIDELRRFGERIIELPGKRGLNAFSNTELDAVLRARGIADVVLAGAVTSICIDSTGRSAHERGYKVSVLSDCTSARTRLEQQFFCESIFPLYAQVLDHDQLLERLEVSELHAAHGR